ncbi:MAG TPA: cupin domain-containing protein [Bacteroides sp.]|nr:cupin domain-containing protein [Bacteroides sp.]
MKTIPPDKVSISQKLSLFNDHWNPRIAGELNGQHVKLAKFRGEFIWHTHKNEDELFYVLNGEFTMEYRDRSILVKEKEFIIVPRGTEHRPVADNEVAVMLFEPISTLNTGDQKGDRTRDSLQKI